MASPQGHLACPTTQPVHHLASQQDMASQPDSEVRHRVSNNYPWHFEPALRAP